MAAKPVGPAVVPGLGPSASMRTFSMRAWARLAATTRRVLVEVFLRPLTNSGTMARKMMPASTTVTISSIKLKPPLRRPAYVGAVIIGSTPQA